MRLNPRKQRSARSANELLQIGGATWRVVKRRSIEHDFYMMRAARMMGLEDERLLPFESAEDFAERLLFRVIGSGKVFELLGGVLLPDAVPDECWTQEEAARTADFLRVLCSPQDKAQVRSLVLSILIGFFSDGLKSAVDSGTVLRSLTHSNKGADAVTHR